MRYFYALMLWLTEYELAISLYTGLNVQHIHALKNDRMRWIRALQDDQLRRLA